MISRQHQQSNLDFPFARPYYIYHVRYTKKIREERRLIPT